MIVLPFLPPPSFLSIPCSLFCTQSLFVNSEQTDDNVVFVEERGQIRPADEQERKHFKLVEVA